MKTLEQRREFWKKQLEAMAHQPYDADRVLQNGRGQLVFTFFANILEPSQRQPESQRINLLDSSLSQETNFQWFKIKGSLPAFRMVTQH